MYNSPFIDICEYIFSALLTAVNTSFLNVLIFELFIVVITPAPADTINTLGEEQFRLNETEVAKEYLVKSGLIISCGGGIVTQERNNFYLKCNSNIVYLDRPLSMLVSDDRPLSAAKGVEVLYEQRKDKYAALADIRVSLDKYDDKNRFFSDAVDILAKGGLSV